MTFDSSVRVSFLEIAESLESQSTSRIHEGRPTTSLVNRIDIRPLGDAAEFSERERALVHLIRFIAQLVDRLQLEVASEGLYDVLPAPELRQLGFENT
jgi:multidrug resistance protein MdtO